MNTILVKTSFDESVIIPLSSIHRIEKDQDGNAIITFTDKSYLRLHTKTKFNDIALELGHEIIGK